MEVSLQIQIDEDLKEDAENIYKNLGLDLQSAIKIFLRRSILASGLPFEMKMSERTLDSLKAHKLLEKLQQQAEENGLSDMTLEEINAEIAAARAERMVREGG